MHEPTSDDDHSRYTGVVVIHGIGDIKRSATLQETLNALLYWFSNEAGLAVRPEGQGRVWLAAELTDDTNPDARASRATLEVVAPVNNAQVLRLQFREVWWAASIGIPSVISVMWWAWVQAREQASRLLLPINKEIWTPYTGDQPQARTEGQGSLSSPDGDGAASSTVAQKPDLIAPQNPIDQHILPTVLGIYGVIQYIWKAIQWLILTPLTLLLLPAMVLLRLLAFIPLLNVRAIPAITGLLDAVMLHWIAPAQVYMLDPTRASVIRERFAHEVNAFLRDEKCTRIVIIAYSLGSVIAYEGLTTPDIPPEFRERITFICLAQALRRIWLMNSSDKGRAHGILPDEIRWIHFWAHYDPVATGPITRRSLPRAEPWADTSTDDGFQKLRDRLDKCENYCVVNTDSIFADHTTYWQNLEQVVGPIAHQLVANPDHPELQELVHEHLARRSRLLGRRWRIGWRALVALCGGIAAAAAVLFTNSVSHDGIGKFLVGFFDSTGVQDFLTQNIPFYKNIVDYLNSGHAIENLGSALSNQGALLPYVITNYFKPATVATSVASLVAFALGVVIIGQFIALPSPFASSSLAQRVTNTPSVFVFTSVAFALAFGAGVMAHYVYQAPFELYAWILSLAELAGVVAYFVAAIDSFQRRNWGWIAFLFLGLVTGPGFPLGEYFFFAVNVGVGVALVGCILAAGNALRYRHWLWALSFLLVGIIASDMTLFPVIPTRIEVIQLIPVLIYSVWAHPAKREAYRKNSGGDQIIVLVSTLCLAIVGILTVQLPQVGYLWALIPAGIAWGLSMLMAGWTRRKNWLLGLPLVLWATFTLLIGNALVGNAFVRHIVFSDFGYALVYIGLYVSFSAFVAAASYSLWAGSPPPPPPPQPQSEQPAGTHADNSAKLSADQTTER